jgi:hypothetical protein
MLKVKPATCRVTISHPLAASGTTRPEIVRSKNHKR